MDYRLKVNDIVKPGLIKKHPEQIEKKIKEVFPRSYTMEEIRFMHDVDILGHGLAFINDCGNIGQCSIVRDFHLNRENWDIKSVSIGNELITNLKNIRVVELEDSKLLKSFNSFNLKSLKQIHEYEWYIQNEARRTYDRIYIRSIKDWLDHSGPLDILDGQANQLGMYSDRIYGRKKTVKEDTIQLSKLYTSSADINFLQESTFVLRCEKTIGGINKGDYFSSNDIFHYEDIALEINIDSKDMYLPVEWISVIKTEDVSEILNSKMAKIPKDFVGDVFYVKNVSECYKNKHLAAGTIVIEENRNNIYTVSNPEFLGTDESYKAFTFMGKLDDNDQSDSNHNYSDKVNIDFRPKRESKESMSSFDDIIHNAGKMSTADLDMYTWYVDNVGSNNEYLERIFIKSINNYPEDRQIEIIIDGMVDSVDGKDIYGVIKEKPDDTIGFGEIYKNVFDIFQVSDLHPVLIRKSKCKNYESSKYFSTDDIYRYANRYLVVDDCGVAKRILIEDISVIKTQKVQKILKSKNEENINKPFFVKNSDGLCELKNIRKGDRVIETDTGDSFVVERPEYLNSKSRKLAFDYVGTIVISDANECKKDALKLKNITNELKTLAKQSQIPVITAQQLQSQKSDVTKFVGRDDIVENTDPEGYSEGYVEKLAVEMDETKKLYQNKFMQEDKKMKNMDMKERFMEKFMPSKISGDEIGISMTGQLLVKRSDGDYVRFDSAKDSIVNEMTFAIAGDTISSMIIIMPTTDVKPGDIIKTNSGYNYVKSVSSGKIITVALETREIEQVVDETNILFGKQIYKKVVSLMSLMTGNSNADTTFGGINPMMFMMLDDNDDEDAIFSMIAMMNMMQASGSVNTTNNTNQMAGFNPMMLMMMDNKSSDMFKMMMMIQMMGGSTMFGNPTENQK